MKNGLLTQEIGGLFIADKLVVVSKKRKGVKSNTKQVIKRHREYCLKNGVGSYKIETL